VLSNQTIATLRGLKLYGMADALEQQLAQPATYDVPFEERLGLLVDRELAVRDRRRLARLLQMARLKQDACLEDLAYRGGRGLDRRQIASLASCAWIRAHQQLLITGATGTGKTFLICAFGQAACRQGLSVFYTRVGRLLEELAIAHGNGTFSRRLQQLAKVDLLLLDDYGLARLTQQERMDLLEVLEERYGSRSTLVASQLPVTSWHEAVGSPTLGDAITDRLLSNAHRIELTGPSIRDPEARPLSRASSRPPEPGSASDLSGSE
jgi:DNA replication protein DnaC